MIDLPVMDRPRKRSVTIGGHPTSVSLEDAFWTGLRNLAVRHDLSVTQLVAEIDRRRPPAVGLATAIRLAVLAAANAAASPDANA